MAPHELVENLRMADVNQCGRKGKAGEGIEPRGCMRRFMLHGFQNARKRVAPGREVAGGKIHGASNSVPEILQQLLIHCRETPINFMNQPGTKNLRSEAQGAMSDAAIALSAMQVV